MVDLPNYPEELVLERGYSGCIATGNRSWNSILLIQERYTGEVMDGSIIVILMEHVLRHSLSMKSQLQVVMNDLRLGLL